MPATAYTPTTTQPITRYQRLLKTAAANEWPREFDPVTGECLGRSVWESRTNLVVRSEEFSDAAWAKSNSTITANQHIAPDGTLTADVMTATADNANINRIIGGVLNGTTYSFSLFVKQGTSDTVRLDFGNVAVGPVFTFSTATMSTVSGWTTAVQNIGNGWYRIAAARASNTTTAGMNIIIPTNGQTVIIWGAQWEAGAFATPYIPTVASQVTRLADSAVMTGVNFSSWFNPSEGTLFADARSYGDLVQGPIAFEIGDGTINNKIVTCQFVSGVVRSMNVQAGNVPQVVLANTADPTLPAKSAGSYKFNDFAGSSNGGTVLTDTVGLVPVVDRAAIGANTSGASNSQRLNGYIKRLTYYPQALTAANLQAVTR